MKDMTLLSVIDLGKGIEGKIPTIRYVGNAL